MIMPNTFDAARAAKHNLEREVAELGQVLASYPRSCTGITPKCVKSSAEYQSDKARFENSFALLRTYTQQYLKEFASELRASRRRFARPHRGL
jgi:hypothetical protein